MRLTGQLLIGFQRVATPSVFRAASPARGVPIEPPFAIADRGEVEQACALAAAAAERYRHSSLDLRARFLDACARHLLDLGDELLARAEEETGLPIARLVGERARTVHQLKLFGAVIRQGDWLGLRIDPAQPQRTPLPRPDLRVRRIPLGPVAVFGASNFPLAFSAAGGDVASALAAGCPVVVKGHPSHPGTSELAALALSQAVRECGLPEGTYSHLAGPGNELGRALVCHPAIQAVAFTGSRAGGLALGQLTASRPHPIPLYAEMSSINPVVVLPGALRARAEAIAAGFVASLTLGGGQFCTNPGLVLGLEGPELERFIAAAGAALAKIEASQMLSRALSASYCAAVERLRDLPGVTSIARGIAGPGSTAQGQLFRAAAREFLANPVLAAEVFGPSSLIVACRDLAELTRVAEHLEGQLTATIHVEASDYPAAAQLLPVLERKAGRILANGWPTGVEVSYAMVHGGPYPATSDSRVSSVGTLAIERFLRPVCYQDVPAAMLPPELTEEGATHFHRIVEGAQVGQGRTS
ncbi:MAG: aldehyde dehydrogenase (NADP(+)) [Steroidobacteraceae bacterium]